MSQDAGTNQKAPTKAVSKSAFVFILLTVFLDSVGIGLIIPVLPKLLTELLNSDLSQAAKWGGYLTVVYAAMQFLCGPLLGNLSDRFGRRPILLGSTAAMALDYVIMALAPFVAVLFIGRIIAGIAGATFATANAYIADITDPEQRSTYFGMIGAAFGMGFVLGPGLGGLVSTFGVTAPFWAAAIVSALNFCLGYFVLKESLSQDQRRAFIPSKANPFLALRNIRNFPGLVLFFAAFFFLEMAHWVYPAVWTYFTQFENGIAWTELQTGLSLSLFGFFSALVQGLLMRRIVKGLGDMRTAFLGLAVNVLGMLCFAFVTDGLYIFLLMPFIALGAIAVPALQGMMSGRVAANSQGELQGLLSSLQALAVLFSPLMMTQIFSFFTDGRAGISFPGSPFICAALLIVLCAFLLFRGLKNGKASAT